MTTDRAVPAEHHPAAHDPAERMELAVVTGLPFVLLAVGALITLLQPAPADAAAVPVVVVLGLTVVAALWVLWFLELHPGWLERTGLMAVYFVGLMVLSAALVVIAPYFGIFALVGYVHAVTVLQGRWPYVGAAATSGVMAVSYLGGPASISADGEWWLWGAVSLVGTVLSCTCIYFAEASFTHGRRQKDALVELHATNARLRAALDENAELHARLVGQARAAGVQDERQRIAREIHDTLAQSLAGILTQLQAADQALDRPAASRRHVTSAITLARDALVEARRTVHAVQPRALDDARLPEALGDLVRRWATDHGVVATLTTTGDAQPMPSDTEVALLRTAQEALANVAKHARAARVGLTLSYMEDLVTLDVRDDGVGFRPGAPVPPRDPAEVDGGFGLAGMRQRVQRLAGRLDIESEPGGGTAICASLPALPVGRGAQ